QAKATDRATRSFRLLDRPWLVAMLALAPLYAAYFAHFLGTPAGSLATGFLQYDQPYYMAIARRYFNGGFPLLYGLPFSPGDGTPRLYFQPQTLLLGVLLKATGLDPGLLYVLFSLAAALVFFRIAIALYGEVVGLRTAAERLGLPVFLWGG